MIKNERSLQVREMSPEDVGQKIAKHCKGNKLIFTVKVTKDNAAKTVLKIAKDRKCMCFELNIIQFAYLSPSEIQGGDSTSLIG